MKEKTKYIFIIFNMKLKLNNLLPYILMGIKEWSEL